MLGAKLLLSPVRKSGLGFEVIDTGLGRTYYRHPTKPGTVICWHDIGTDADVELLVFDAIYRKVGVAWGLLNVDSSLPNLKQQNANNTWYINGSNVPVSPGQASKLAETQLNTLWPADRIDPNTARYNCEVWESLGLDDCPALQHARTVVTSDGHKADIPNIQQLMRIFCMADIIDENDPTLISCPTLSLAEWFNGYVWSSSEYDFTWMRYIVRNGYCSGSSKDNVSAKDGSPYAAVPVLELNLAA